MTRYTPSVFTCRHITLPTGPSRHMTGGHTGRNIINFFRRMFSDDGATNLGDFTPPPPPYSATSTNSSPPPYPVNLYDIPQPIYDRLIEIASLSNKVHCYGRLLVLYANLRNIQDINTANIILLNEVNVIRVYLPEFNNEEVNAMFYVLRPFA